MRRPWPLRSNDRRHRRDPEKNEKYSTEQLVSEGGHYVGTRRGFDLDPCASALSHWGRTWWTKEQNGLLLPWFGYVYVNPPYDDLAAWVLKAWRETQRHEVLGVAMLIPVRPEQPFWQGMIRPLRDLRWQLERCRPFIAPEVAELLVEPGGRLKLTVEEIEGRPEFWSPSSPAPGSAPFPCCFLIWR